MESSSPSYDSNAPDNGPRTRAPNLAEVIVVGAIAHIESRGAYYRVHFPARDDKNWMKYTIARRTPGAPKLSYAPVGYTHFGPKERVC
jgi:succinate dehydrogenase / fumarate reductase, flavoprotein subunit